MAKRGKPAPKAPVQKIRVKGKHTAPIATRALRDLVGVTKAAEFTGISTAQFHKAGWLEQVSMVTEVACRGVLKEMGVPLEHYGLSHVAAVPVERYMLKARVPRPVRVPEPAPRPVVGKKAPKVMHTADTANDAMLDALAARLLDRIKLR